MESDEGQEVSHLLQLIYTVHQEHLHIVNAPLPVVPLLFCTSLLHSNGEKRTFEQIEEIRHRQQRFTSNK